MRIFECWSVFLARFTLNLIFCYFIMIDDGIIFPIFHEDFKSLISMDFGFSVSLSFLLKLINQYGRYLHKFTLWFCTSTIFSFFKNSVIWHSNQMLLSIECEWITNQENLSLWIYLLDSDVRKNWSSRNFLCIHPHILTLLFGLMFFKMIVLFTSFPILIHT